MCLTLCACVCNSNGCHSNESRCSMWVTLPQQSSSQTVNVPGCSSASLATVTLEGSGSHVATYHSTSSYPVFLLRLIFLHLYHGFFSAHQNFNNYWLNGMLRMNHRFITLTWLITTHNSDSDNIRAPHSPHRLSSTVSLSEINWVNYNYTKTDGWERTSIWKKILYCLMIKILCHD